jgi:hypothetical protein
MRAAASAQVIVMAVSGDPGVAPELAARVVEAAHHGALRAISTWLISSYEAVLREEYDGAIGGQFIYRFHEMFDLRAASGSGRFVPLEVLDRRRRDLLTDRPDRPRPGRNGLAPLVSMQRFTPDPCVETRVALELVEALKGLGEGVLTMSKASSRSQHPKRECSDFPLIAFDQPTEGLPITPPRALNELAVGRSPHVLVGLTGHRVL